MAVNFGLGFGLAVGVSLVAYRLRLLTWDGALLAIVIGTTVFGIGGWQASVPLLAFFFSASLLPRFIGKRERGEQRTAIQVLANGGIPALCCWLTLLFPESGMWVGYLASVAFATGDTWATELGTRLGGTPRLITTGKLVAVGTSGGITLVGTLGALIGSALPVGVGASFLGLNLLQAGVAWGAGFLGGLFDSLLGATVQARFECPLCGKRTENRTHCGGRTLHRQGWRWLDNHGVNLAASGFSALVALGMG